jgi:hypothetical protein
MGSLAERSRAVARRAFARLGTQAGPAGLSPPGRPRGRARPRGGRRAEDLNLTEARKDRGSLSPDPT